MKTIRVALAGRTYPVLIGSGILADTGRLLRKQGIAQNHALVVSQKEVAALYEKPVLDSLKKEGISVSVF